MPDGVLWVGFFPRALDRLDRKTGRVTHYLPAEDGDALGEGNERQQHLQGRPGYLWLGGWAAAVSTGSTSALDASSTTGTTLAILIA